MPPDKSGNLTHGHPAAVRSRNRAILATVGVISGAVLLFRALGPKQDGYVVSKQEIETMRGGDQATGIKTPRAPEKGLKTP